MQKIVLILLLFFTFPIHAEELFLRNNTDGIHHVTIHAGFKQRKPVYVWLEVGNGDVNQCHYQAIIQSTKMRLRNQDTVALNPNALKAKVGLDYNCASLNFERYEPKPAAHIYFQLIKDDKNYIATAPAYSTVEVP